VHLDALEGLLRADARRRAQYALAAVVLLG
jgi:hypothetical protein